MLQFGVFDLNLGEILAYFANDVVVGWILVGTGILCAAWLLENITDPIPLLGSIFDLLVSIGTYLGFFIGILDVIVGYIVFATQPGAMIVAGVLILAGFALIMRVLSKFPLAFLFALGIAAIGTFTIYGFLVGMVDTPVIGEYVAQIISLKWMLGIGFVIFAVVYLLAGLLIKLIELIGKIFASTPVIVLIGLGALAIGIVMLIPGFAEAYLGIVLPWPPPPTFGP
jgi:hypothetical protein